MLPPAPDWLKTTIVPFIALDKPSPRSRATASVEPPGGDPAMSLTGPRGYSLSASANPERVPPRIAPPKRASVRSANVLRLGMNCSFELHRQPAIQGSGLRKLLEIDVFRRFVRVMNITWPENEARGQLGVFGRFCSKPRHRCLGAENRLGAPDQLVVGRQLWWRGLRAA